MKKIFLFAFLFLVFVSVAYAGTIGPGPFGAGGMLLPGWINQGGGWFYNNLGGYHSNDSGSIQAYTSQEFGALMTAAQSQSVISQIQPITPGSCTGSETPASCHPEWAEALANCVSGTFNPSQSTCEPKNSTTRALTSMVSVCSATNTTGPCRPARVNSYGANYVVGMAQQVGRAQGYTVSCTSERLGFGGIGTDTNTNLDYYYNNICTVNGTPGHSAEILAGSTNWSGWSFTPGVRPVGSTSQGGTSGGTTGGTVSSGSSSGSSSSQSIITSQQQIGVSLTNQYTNYINTLLSKALSQLSDLQQQLKNQVSTGSSDDVVVLPPVTPPTSGGSNPPTITFTVNGGESIDAQYNEGLMFDWSSTNATELKAEVSYTYDPAQTVSPTLRTFCVDTFEERVSTLNPFNRYLDVNSRDEVIPLSGKRPHAIFRICSLGRIYTVKLTARNASGQTASDSVKIRSINLPATQEIYPLIDSVTATNSIYNSVRQLRSEYIVSPGGTISGTIRGRVMPRPTQSLNTEYNMQILYSAPFPISAVTVSSIPSSSITATVGQVTEVTMPFDLSRSFSYPVTIRVPQGTPRGFYFIRFSFREGNNNTRIMDYPVFVD